MAVKPADKINWGATGNIVEPSGSRKTSGWLEANKPPAENFNWKWELDTRTALFLLGDSESWIVIDSVNADEADYASIVAYLADTPAAGDKLLVKTDEVIATSLILPANIVVRLLKGVKITTVADIANAIELSDGITIEGSLVFEPSHTGVITNAIIFNGDDINVDLAIGDNKSTGTVTNMFSITAGKVNCFGRGVAKNSGAGTLTNAFVDNSTTDSNHVIIMDDPASTFIRSDGANHVALSDDSDLLGGNNSAFYRNAGNLNAGILPAARFDDTAHGARGGGTLHAASTTTAKGFVELATNAEAITGTDTERAVTPAGVAAAIGATASGFAFSAHKNGTDQTGIVSGVWTKVTFGTEDFDVDSVFASSRYTPGVLGEYDLMAAFAFQNLGSTNTRTLAIYKNGVIYKQHRDRQFQGAADEPNAIAIKVQVDDIADYFEVYAFHNKGSDDSIKGDALDTWFMGSKI